MNQSYLHFLQAQHGDSIIVHCCKEENSGVIVVDGGTCSNPRLNFFVKAVEELCTIDLVILTHHDSDHIAGILNYFKRHSEDDTPQVREVWANCANHIEFSTDDKLSSKQAEKLADYLNKLQSENKIKWRSDIHSGRHTIEFPYATIEIIGPLPGTYQRFMETYASSISSVESTPVSYSENKDVDIPCGELSLRKKTPPDPNNYSALTNMASISFILRCDGLSVLMLADSFPQEIVQCLTEKEYSKEHKLKVDYVKVAHHGSRHNTSNELLDIIDCDNFIISTNGGFGQSRHPQREAIANILCHPERDYTKTVNLFFNYPLTVIQRSGNKIFNDKLDQDLNYKVYGPTTDSTIATGYRIPAY